MPIILSIITINYNNIRGLKATLESFDNHKSIEHIIVDGNSTDGSIELINQQNTPNTIKIIERDNGIYDAMNKGLQLANGLYVLFMNSGDLFFNKKVVPNLLKLIHKEKPDIIYGDTMYIDKDFNNLGLRSIITTRSLPKKYTWLSNKKGMVVCHQSFISKRSITSKFIDDNLSADIDWQIRCLKRASKVIKYKECISKYQIGGISQQRHMQSLGDRWKVLVRHYGVLSALYSHIYFVLRQMFFTLTRIKTI